MELTGLGFENYEAFKHLMPDVIFDDYVLGIGAIEDNKAAGVALFNFLGDAIMLDYIYVAEPFRRKGIATAMIDGIIEQLIVYPVAMHINYSENASDIHEFVIASGFKIFRDGHAWRVPVKNMINSAVFNKLIDRTPGHRVVPLKTLTNDEKVYLKEALNKEDMDPSCIDDRALSSAFSLVTLDNKTGRPIACVLCEHDKETITLSYLVSFSKDMTNLIDLFRALKEACLDSALEDATLTFVTMNDNNLKLAEKLVGKENLISDGDVISGIRMI